MLRRRLLPALALLLLLALVPLSASAKYYDTFPIQSGFGHAPKAGDDSGAGLLLPGSAHFRRSSPTIADIDGNTANGKEIVVGSNDGTLYAYHANGTPVWAPRNVLPAACSYNASTDGILNSTPAVGKLFGGSTNYIVVGYGTIQQTNCDGGIVVYNGATGDLVLRFSLRTWLQSQGYNEKLYSVVSSPALADTDFDGQMEIGFGGLDRNVYLLNASGSVRWYFHAADTVWASPAFTNIDSDPELEMIASTDISPNSKIKPPTIGGGFVYAFDTQARAPKRTDLFSTSSYIWRSINFDQVLYSSPTVVDFEGDGVKEIVTGSGCFFNPGSQGHWLKILDSRNGAVIRTLNADSCVTSSPAIGDIDGDGELEIVASINGQAAGAPYHSYVQAWDYDNPTPKWTIDPLDSLNRNDPYLDDIASPVLADLDGNGSLEVLVSNFSDVVVLRGSTGQQLTCRACMTGPGRAMYTLYTTKSTPAVGDLDGDGDLEVVIGGGGSPNFGEKDKPYLYVWTNFAGLLGSSAGTLPHYSAPWPMFRGNPQHTGVYTAPALRANSTSMALLTEEGGPSRTFRVNISDAAGGAINWTASKNQPWITLSATNGTTPDGLNVTINPSGKDLGTYTGVLSLNSSFGAPEIDIILIVADEVTSVYLPLAQR